MNYRKHTVNIIMILTIFCILIAPVLQADDVLRGQDKGEEVEELQVKLKKLSYYQGRTDGVFGVKTELSLKEFQKDYNLRADGIAGLTTFEKLDSILEKREESGEIKEIEPQKNESKILRGKDRGEAVEELQIKLKRLGYYQGRTDGMFGVKTELSLKKFQREQNLRADGLAGPTTFDRLDAMLEKRDERDEKQEREEQEARGEKKPEQRKSMILNRGDKGGSVKKLQNILRKKGFLNGSSDGIFGLQTEIAVNLAQQFYGLNVDGVAGPGTWEALNRKETTYRTYKVKSGDTLWELARNWSASVEGLKRINSINDGAFIKAGDRIKIPGDVEPEKVNVIHWRRVDEMIDYKDIIILTDVETKLSFRVQRLGGTNHADVEPLTAKDTRVFKQIYGGDWSWERRAIIAHINGMPVAASINGQPHANESIRNNNFPGHICLHFRGSKLHLEEKQDNDHQEMVEKAGEYYWPLVH